MNSKTHQELREWGRTVAGSPDPVTLAAFADWGSENGYRDFEVGDYVRYLMIHSHSVMIGRAIYIASGRRWVVVGSQNYRGADISSVPVWSVFSATAAVEAFIEGVYDVTDDNLRGGGELNTRRHERLRPLADAADFRG